MSINAVRPHNDEAQAIPDDVPQLVPAWRGNFFQGFVYALAGVKYAVLSQRNMRVHLACFALALGVGLVLRISPLEFALIVFASMGVIVAEMFNTVAEACVDLATREYHPLAKVAKDVAAGAVLLAAGFAVVIALLVFGPHLIALLTRQH